MMFLILINNDRFPITRPKGDHFFPVPLGKAVTWLKQDKNINQWTVNQPISIRGPSLQPDVITHDWAPGSEAEQTKTLAITSVGV